MPDNTDLGIKTNASVSRCYHRVKNVPKNYYDISFRKVAAVAETLKEFAADSELESDVLLCLRLEPFIGFDLKKDNRTCLETNNRAGARAHREGKRGGGTHNVGTIDSEALEHLHLAPYDLLIPLDSFRGGLQYDLACDVPWRGQSGGMARGSKESDGVRVVAVEALDGPAATVRFPGGMVTSCL